MSSAEALAALEVTWPKSPLGTELTETSGITVLVKYLYDWGVSLGGFAVFIVLVMAGFQYLSSAGNPTKMKEARDRIRDAVLGLVLLLGSVLILNTINPQLTQLRVPSLPPAPKEWDIGFNAEDIKKIGLEDCKTVKLYSGIGYSTEILPTLGPGDVLDPIPGGEVGSADITGSCQLTLYRLAGFKTNADYPSVVIAGDIENMGVLGETKFRSAKVINFNFKLK